MGDTEVIISNKKVKKNIDTYDILRVVATLLVILSHCGYYNIITKYGSINYGEKLELLYGDTLIHIVFELLVKFIYTFHMPLFIGLAGALFYVQVKNNKFKSIRYLIVNKAKRLLIPFVVITVVYSVPIKYISGYFQNSNNLLKDIILGQVLLQGNTYLWFLPTLFLCFIIMYLSEKYIKINTKYKIIIFICLNLLSYSIPIMIIKYVLQYALWFYFGFIFEHLREKINARLEINKSLWLVVVLGIVSIYFIKDIVILENTFIFKVIEKLIMILVAIMECLLMYMLSFKMYKLNIHNKFIFKKMIKSSFGLYLYSDPINYLILDIIYRASGLSLFITEVGSFIIIILRIIGTFFIAFIITKILKRLRIKYIV